MKMISWVDEHERENSNWIQYMKFEIMITFNKVSVAKPNDYLQVQKFWLYKLL